MSTTQTLPTPEEVDDTEISAVDQLAAMTLEVALLRCPDDIVDFAERVASACTMLARRERDRRLRERGARFRVVEAANFAWHVMAPTGERVATLPTEEAARRHAEIRNDQREQQEAAA